MVGNTRTLFWPGGLRRAAFLGFGLIIGLAAVVTPTVSAQAAGPPITDPKDSRCQRVDPENLFFINLQTPPSGQAVGPGSTVGSWFSDESGLNTNSLSPGLPFHIVFRMTGPSGPVDLQPDISESFDQRSVFTPAKGNKECGIQTNIKSKIPATVNGNPLPAGSYTVTLTAFDNDQTRNPGPDMGTQTWHFSVAAQVAPASPTPAGGTAGAGTVGGAGSASGQQVLGALTTVPSLPNTGHPVATSRPDWATIAVLLSLGAAAGIAIRHRLRRLKPVVLSR